MTPEGKVKAMVKRRMEEAFPGCYRFMPVQNGMGAPTLDFLYCVGGFFVGIETKTKGKKATPRQVETMRQIVNAGGMAFVVAGTSEEAMTLVIDLIKYKMESYRDGNSIEGSQEVTGPRN